MLKVEEDFKSCPNKKIISFLMKLRKSSKMGAVDKKTFKMLVDLIKMPNAKILNYTLSILANCCVKNIYRTMFMELGGLPHLILIVNTIENDSIMCRACRLVGNLALNTEVAKELCEKDTDLALLKVLERHENLSSDTLIMTFRAVK